MEVKCPESYRDIRIFDKSGEISYDQEGGENSNDNTSQDEGEVFEDQKENSDPLINNTFDSEGIVNEPEDADIGMKTNGLEQVILPLQSFPPLVCSGRIQGDPDRDDDCPGRDPVERRPDDGGHQDSETGEGCSRSLPSPSVPSCCMG